MTANATTYYESPAPPDESGDWLTLEQLAEMWGLSEAAVRRFVNDSAHPLSFSRNDDGVILVSKGDADEYDKCASDKGGLETVEADWRCAEKWAEGGGMACVANRSEELGESNSSELGLIPGACVNASQVAKATGLSTASIKRMANRREERMPHIKRRTRSSISKHKLAEYLASIGKAG